MSIIFDQGSETKSTKNLKRITDGSERFASATQLGKYETNYAFINKSLNTVRKNLNIGSGFGGLTKFDSVGNNLRNTFNRFLIPFPDKQLPKTFGHIFFTRPDLNLFTDFTNQVLVDGVKTDPLFDHLFRSDPDILKLLTSNYSSDHVFNPYLSNLAKNFELKDDVLETVDTGETFTGYKMRYGRHNIKNKTADSFSIKYIEDSDYGVYKIHKAWTDYISKVYRGYFRPHNDNIKKRILDYVCSIYYFLCGPDGETILFWSKYTGVYPTSAPSSYSSWQAGDVAKTLEYSVEYQYAWKDDYNPIHIAEFNIQSMKTRLDDPIRSRVYMKTYDPDVVGTGMTFSYCPFVEKLGTGTKNDPITYKLRFEPIGATGLY